MANSDIDFRPQTSSHNRLPSGQSFMQKAMAMQIEAIRHSLDYMPDAQQRHFYDWILNQDGIRDRWLQLVSVTKTIVLTHKLLDGVLTEDELDYLLPYSTIINTYLLYEVISDNLAIGLAKRQKGDDTFDKRRQLLHCFDAAISERVRDMSTITAVGALCSLRPLMREISAFNQSLNPMQHKQIAEAYLHVNGNGIRANDLEYNLYSGMVANFEACLAFNQVIREFEIYPALQDGLALRYEGINRLLGNEPLTLEALVDIGTDTILVVPTVGYYAAIIGEILRPTSGYQVTLENGLLLHGLRTASLLVRLLNDMGTAVLNLTPDERKTMFRRIRDLQTQHCFVTFDDLLLNVTEHYGTALTRLKKDLKFGEFNVGLYTALQAETVDQAIDVFEVNLDSLCDLYQSKQQSLHQSARQLSQQVGGVAIAEVIMRFVKFHEMTYSYSFEDSSGEYAI